MASSPTQRLPYASEIILSDELHVCRRIKRQANSMKQTTLSRIASKKSKPQEKKLVTNGCVGDRNLNNVSGEEEADTSRQTRRPDLPLAFMVRLIVLTLRKIADPKGSSLKDIRKFLVKAGVIDESNDLRQAMIVALKLGAVARPVWAIRTGLYGRYVEGDGIPIFAGRKSRPKHSRHRRSEWVSGNAKTAKRKSGKSKGKPKKISRRK
ncbi:hypothetical protein PoB_001759400 [Plakobranchus ocellatus]|uniref:H15 domain-containing protein n=1 Tax=Plakobranchus ocellatus TaxID=259542 RepID=A0AAV3ZAW8_9GAST|nr:hypothetical protein PoB_001759400 [Plakobranchus ocellatus]